MFHRYNEDIIKNLLYHHFKELDNTIDVLFVLSDLNFKYEVLP